MPCFLLLMSLCMHLASFISKGILYAIVIVYIKYNSLLSFELLKYLVSQWQGAVPSDSCDSIPLLETLL